MYNWVWAWANACYSIVDVYRFVDMWRSVAVLFVGVYKVTARRLCVA